LYVFETIYLLREVVKRAVQSEVRIPVEALRAAVRKLLEEDNIAIYSSEAGLDEDLRTLQKQSLLTVDGGYVVIHKEGFLNATEFAERQEELLKGDRYAAYIFEKLKQKAEHIHGVVCWVG
jgi:hypothetical protein